MGIWSESVGSYRRKVCIAIYDGILSFLPEKNKIRSNQLGGKGATERAQYRYNKKPQNLPVRMYCPFIESMEICFM